MKVKEEHIIDAGEKDKNGYYEYHYEYDLYEFSFKKFTLVARSYKNETEASFHASFINGKREMVHDTHVGSIEMNKAIQYLQSKGKDKFSVLTELGYAPLIKQPPKPSLLKRLLGRA